MGQAKTTRKSMEKAGAFGLLQPTSGILVAHAPPGAVAVDRSAVRTPFTIGRSTSSDFAVHDEKVSGCHCRIVRNNNALWLEDLNSTNGTFLDGAPVIGPRALGPSGVIRIGATILVFLERANPMLLPSPAVRYDLLGPFHAGPLVRALQEAALSSRHLLLAGASGVGKELAARTLAAITGGDAGPRPLTAHNAARFTSEDEATTTLFGVGAKVFTNVESRPGLIEQAEGGILFLDEIHNLPARVQRSLLRVIEEGRFTRIGETRERPADVRFVFASNAPPPSFDMATDLLARLRVVSIPSLKERVADMPHLFKRLLERALSRNGRAAAQVLSLLGGDHYEAICLDGFEDDNVRGLIDLADRVATRMEIGVSPEEAVLSVFGERFRNGTVAARYENSGSDAGSTSHYEQNREIITALFRECRGNLSATERALAERGIKCTRRWLGVFAERWGLRTTKKS